MTNSPRIIVIGCAQSAGVAIEELQTSGKNLPANVEWVSFPCGSSIDALHIMRAFESGADRVMVLACFDGACRSEDGNKWAERRVAAARALLEEAGIARWRLAFHNIAPTMAADLHQWIEAFRELEPVAEAEG